MQWLDADDLLASDKIERQVEVVRGGISDRTLLSGAWGSFHYRPRKAVFEPSALWESLSPVDWLVAKMSGNLHMQPDAWLVSRALTEDAGPWDTGLWRDNDGEYFCRVLLASDKVCFVPEARTYYRTAGFNNISYIGRSNRKLESLFRSLRLHVQYLRSLEDTDRTRSACVRYLNNWVSEFYPDRMDFVDRLRILAEELGGRIEVPTLSWKYEWIRRAFGWEAAKQSQLRLRKLRNSLVIGWDRLLYAAERRRDHSTRASRTLPQGRAS